MNQIVVEIGPGVPIEVEVHAPAALSVGLTPIGVSGPQGATGATGAQGATGPTGPQGLTGPQGPAGNDGAQGPAGPQGATGATGPTGPGVPAGGADGALLIKSGVADYVAGWLSTTAFGRSLLALAEVAALRTAIALPTTTVAGRLARYTDVAGEQGQTAGIYEDARGNVGIGTTEPSETLHIQTNEAGAGSALLRLDNGGTAGNETGLELWSAPTDTVSSLRAGRIYSVFDTGSYTGARLSFQSMSTGDVLVDTMHLKGGNVGIGTTAPEYPLTLGATPRFGVRSDGVVYWGQNVASASLANAGSMSWSTGTVSIGAVSTATDFLIVNQGVERVRVTASGNVGVGVAPLVKLDVDGPIRCKSYTVATVPSAAVAAGQQIYVSNERGGGVLAFSDGTSWRRVTDRAVIS